MEYPNIKRMPVIREELSCMDKIVKKSSLNNVFLMFFLFQGKVKVSYRLKPLYTILRKIPFLIVMSLTTFITCSTC